MRFQFWSMPEDSRVGDFVEGSSLWVCLVVLYQGYCSSGQYNLSDRMLRLDANTTLNQSYALFITLINITYQSRDQYLPSIHSWDNSPWQLLSIPLFCFACVFRVVLVFFKWLVFFNQFSYSNQGLFLYYFLFLELKL